MACWRHLVLLRALRTLRGEMVSYASAISRTSETRGPARPARRGGRGVGALRTHHRIRRHASDAFGRHAGGRPLPAIAARFDAPHCYRGTHALYFSRRRLFAPPTHLLPGPRLAGQPRIVARTSNCRREGIRPANLVPTDETVAQGRV